MKTREPTRKEVDELLAFLPILYMPGFQPLVRWEGGDKNVDGSINMPWPVYAKEVEAFYAALGNECWLDYEYIPEEAMQMLEHEETIQTASLGQIKSMLTFCLRGERFSEGLWASVIEDGTIRRLLERLAVLRDQMPDPAEGEG